MNRDLEDSIAISTWERGIQNCGKINAEQKAQEMIKPG